MKYLTQIILILSLVLLPDNNLKAQKGSLIEVQSIVQDSNGNPVPGAVINSEEGLYYAKADNTGAFAIRCTPSAILTIGAKGYKTIEVPATNVSQKIILEKMPFQMTESDAVKMPFETINKRQTVGAISTIHPEDFEGFDATQDFSTALAVRGLGILGRKSIRGTGYTIIVDGIKRGAGNSPEIYSDMLNLQEIAEVTILKDAASKALYGSHAEKGIILITTKRGEANKRTISVTAETGLRDPIDMPKFLNSADYMELFNEALVNDGLVAKYDQTTISNSRSGSDIYKYPNQDYYSSEFLKSSKPFSKVITEFSGGNLKDQYYLNIGWDNQGSLLKVGEGSKTSQNQLNLRGNIDIELNKWIKANVDAVSIINFYHNPNFKSSNFWSLASYMRPVDFTPLIPVNRIIASDRSLVSTAARVNDDYILGGNSIYTQNLYGDLNLGGYVNGTRRISQINMGLDFNLDFILPKLKFRTYFTYDNYNAFESFQTNQYAVYEPTFTPDDSISITKIGVDNFVGSQSTQNTFFYRMYSLSNVLSYQNTFNDIHSLDVVAVMLIDSYKETGFFYNDKHVNSGLHINYMFKNKYVAEFDGSLSGSQLLDKGHRWGFAPVAGLAWIASEEEFLRNLSVLNFLKIKVSYGNVKTDIDRSFATYHLYHDMYTRYGSFPYADGTYTNLRTQVLNIGNSDVSWIERNELNLGAEASLFDNTLFAELNYFNSKRFNELSQLTNTYFNFLGGATFTPFQNFGARVEQGFELGMNYSKRAGNFSYNIGLNIVHYKPVLKIVDELDYGPDQAYRQRAGKAADAIWGYEAIGLFANDADILASPVQTFGAVYPGDIKYRDINSDGTINDDDQTIIGYSNPRYNYVFSINLKYKNFDLFTYFQAQSGRSSLYTNSYYWVYGDLKYPEYIKDRWIYDPVSGIDSRDNASYPRLSSRSNSNNLRNSSYWVYNNNYLNIPAVQLSYTLPERISRKLYARSLSLYCRATDILMIAANKNKMQLNTATEPQMRSYSIGLKAQF